MPADPSSPSNGDVTRLLEELRSAVATLPVESKITPIKLAHGGGIAPVHILKQRVQETVMRGEGGRLAEQDGFTVLLLPASSTQRRICLYSSSLGPKEIAALAAADEAPPDLAPLTRGGPPRWHQTVNTQAVIGESGGPFAVDTLTLPDANP